MGDAVASASSWAALPPKLSEDDFLLFRSLSDREQETLHSSLSTLPPSFFASVVLSPLALLQMLLHAHRGSPLEVMGLMIGSVQSPALSLGETLVRKRLFNGFVVSQAFSLPVEGTETRVNAGAEANEYMVEFVRKAEQAYSLPVCPGKKTERKGPEPGREREAFGSQEREARSGEDEGYASEEGAAGSSRVGDDPHGELPLPVAVVGWYHSHPGYRCWLSGIDVQTQRLHQRGQDPFLAVVVDPTRTAATGQVDIGAFRCYPEGYCSSPLAMAEETARSLGAASSSPESKAGARGRRRPPSSLPLNKVADFGVHWREYYKLDVRIVPSSLDILLLERLCADAWPSAILGPQRGIAEQRAYRTSQVSDLVVKTRQAEAATFRRNVGGVFPRPAASDVLFPRDEGLVDQPEPMSMDTGEPRGDSPSLPPAPGACSASIIDEGPTLSPFASQQDTLFGVAEDAKRQRRMQKQRFSSTGSRLRRKYASKGMMEDDPLDNLARETRAFVRDQQEIRLTSAITEILFGRNRPTWLETKRRVRERRLRTDQREATD